MIIEEQVASIFPAVEAIVCPDRETWLRRRMEGIGSSDAAGVLGCSPWTDAVRIYCAKIGRMLQQEETAEMRRGREMEPKIRALYAERHPEHAVVDLGEWTILRALVTPYLQATIDGAITGDPRGPGVMEIKTSRSDRGWSSGPPIQYVAQVQHQILVTGATWAVVAVLFGGSDYLEYPVSRDEELIALMVGRESEFWSRVQRRDPPIEIYAAKER